VDQATARTQLQGMLEPYGHWRAVQDGQVLVGFGPRVMFCFDEQDQGMRNLAAVALTQAGAKVGEVAELFGLSREHVSRLRTRTADRGSKALLAPRGAPRKLSETQRRRAVKLSEGGVTGAEIARRMGVSEATISRLLARQPREAVQGELELYDSEAGDVSVEGEPSEQTPAAAEEAAVPGGQSADDGDATVTYAAEGGGQEPRVVPGGLLGRLGETEVQSRYAGAMLLYPFLERLGVGDVLSALPAPAARRYDAPALVLASSFSFALGGSSLEQAKHLRPADAGALLGLCALPSVRTLRPAMARLAEASDPLLVQRSFATAMLKADEHPPELFYVDDHFVTYWGAQPVAKGYNIRRHLAEPGRDDTFVVDDRWRGALTRASRAGCQCHCPGYSGS